MKNKKSFTAIALLALLGVATAQAETPEEKGYNIFKAAEDQDEGYGDSESDMLMILKNKQEATSEREMSTKNLEGKGEEGDKSLMVFLSPRDQAGTALLTHQHKNRDDDQWLYLPALKRVKKIASSKKSGPFMGSEFSFEDIGGQSLEDYTYKYLRDEPCHDGLECYVVESYPKDENSGYTRIVTWVDKEHYRTVKAEFYDRKKSHLKTMTASGFKQYKDKFWRPEELLMVNHQTGRSTVLKQTNIEFDTSLSDSDFNKNSLKRARY
ncbi:MAG: outer membrane lipoprotein-sorting protein [Pseudomonadales bacterium]|nr:outer membrane lipoprotein-sorting protein [Pseudomonadales bacterium]